MAHQDLSGTGIVTGQTVEASQITQFVNAFTGQPVSGKGYDITISGSLNLTGSLLMTGSLINEFSGQFSALGIGVTAPTAPTMLHIKDTSGAGDPIALLEGETDTDSARIRFQNDDVSYDVGAYGSSGDSFMIVQDQSGTPKFQFIINKNEPSYALQVQNGVVGSGMGAGFTSNPSNLPNGSIQALATVSGSLLSGGIISASAAGPTANIHGTASWASNVITAATASYTKLGSIDMSGGNTAAYSASGNFNSQFNIVSNGGIIDGTHLRFKTVIQDTNGAEVISGNLTSNNLIIGDIEGEGASGNGPIIQFDVANDKILLVDSQGNAATKNSLVVDGDTTVKYNSFISGSATPSLVVGPNAASGTANSPSSSLLPNDLQFNRNNTAYISNANENAGSALAFSAQGGSSNVAMRISGSKDVVFENTIIKNTSEETGDMFKAVWNIGENESSSNNRVLYAGKKFSITSNGTADLFTFESALRPFTGTGGIGIKAKTMFTKIDSTGAAFIETMAVFSEGSGGIFARDAIATIQALKDSTLSNVSVDIVVGGGSNNHIIVRATGESGTNTRACTWVEIFYISEDAV